MINLQKISLFFVLIVLLGKHQVLGGCGSSKAASPDTADATDSSHSYRTHPAQKPQEHRKSDAVSGTQTKFQLNITPTQEVQNGGAGAVSQIHQRDLNREHLKREEESIEPPLKEKPTIERQSNGRKNPIIQPPLQSKKEAAINRRVQKRKTLGAQTRALHQTAKSSQPLHPTRLKNKPQVATAAGSRNGTKSSSKKQSKLKVAFSTEGGGAGRSPAPLKVEKRVEKLPQTAQKKQELLITVSSPGDVRTDSAQSRNGVLKSNGVKLLQSEQDKTVSVAATPLNDLQTPRLTAEEERAKLTPSSPKKVASALEKPTERIQEKGRELPEFALSLPGQTPPTGASELGTARREMSPALSMSAALILSASAKNDEGKREKADAKILETMKSFLKGNKLIPLGSESLAFYEKALMESKPASTKISTRNFRSHESNHMGRLLDILAAATHLREIIFEDPFDFVYTGGAGKAGVRISLGDMFEKLTGSKSLQTISFRGLPREDQLSDFTSNFKEFIKENKTRKFTVIFRDVPAKQDADREYRSITTSLRSAFTDERVVFKMKE